MRRKYMVFISILIFISAIVFYKIYIRYELGSKNIYYYNTEFSDKDNNLLYWFSEFNDLSYIIAGITFSEKEIITDSTYNKISHIIKNPGNQHGGWLTTCSVSSCLITYDYNGDVKNVVLFTCNKEQIVLISNGQIIDRVIMNNQGLKLLSSVLK